MGSVLMKIPYQRKGKIRLGMFVKVRKGAIK
jgi:hypothetical protein